MKRTLSIVVSALVIGFAGSALAGGPGQGGQGALHGGWIAPVLMVMLAGYFIKRQVAAPACGYVQQPVTYQGQQVYNRSGQPESQMVYVCPRQLK